MPPITDGQTQIDHHRQADHDRWPWKDPQLILKKCHYHPPHCVSTWTQLFFRIYYSVMIRMFFFSLAMVESNFFFIVDIVLPVVSFLLSFLFKSCYLKKTILIFCVVSLFYFLHCFLKWVDVWQLLSSRGIDVTYLRSAGAVWPPTSRGRHAEMQILATGWMKHCSLFYILYNSNFTAYYFGILVFLWVPFWDKSCLGFAIYSGLLSLVCQRAANTRAKLLNKVLKNQLFTCRNNITLYEHVIR